MPDQVFGGHFGADVAHLRAHVAVCELEPRTRKHLGEVVRVFVEALRNHTVRRVHLHGHVGVGHDGVVANAGVFHIDRFVFFQDVDGFPLPRASGALFELPVVGEQEVEIAVVPLGGVGGPCAFDAAGHGVSAHTTAGVVHPTQALFDHVCAFWIRAQVLRLAIAVALAHGVAARREGHGFFVVHGHAGKGQAHVLRCAQWVGLAVHAFGVHVDQAHLHSGQGVF